MTDVVIFIFGRHYLQKGVSRLISAAVGVDTSVSSTGIIGKDGEEMPPARRNARRGLKKATKKSSEPQNESFAIVNSAFHRSPHRHVIVS